jgi:hypothetical protein
LIALTGGASPRGTVVVSALGGSPRTASGSDDQDWEGRGWRDEVWAVDIGTKAIGGFDPAPTEILNVVQLVNPE